jgi:hypothetical protein
MFECDMSGCFDTAEYLAVFDGEIEALEICQGCADFWANQITEGPMKLTPLRENKEAAKNA